MSSKILGNVWDACAAHDIKGAKLVIMARLADYSNDDGVCYPSVETICRQLGLGESTVRTAIAELESSGWLRREARRKGNRNTSNLYHLNAERLEALARIEKDKVAALKQQRRT
ncbi:TPA: helix-turn-helix domain-containing protein, partial [Enterobacter hormaechei]|nr:helix-turn-helix domain-containing protein [Enterobacter hormaechei]